MTVESLKEKAKQMTICYFDNYCGTGFVIAGGDLLASFDCPLTDLEISSAIMEGMMEGIAAAEVLHREGLEFRGSPLQQIEKLLVK